MSRYVDLDGKTWDGTQITSKIQEVKTKYGYMQGITIGWLWGDNVPHIDLEEHDKKVIQNYIDNVVEELENEKNIGGLDLNYLDYTDGINKAIEIVKAGVKNDD